MSRSASLVSTGLYLPEREISNDLLRERFPEPPDLIDKFEASTGIRRRWWAPEDWAASDLAVRAARQALENAGRRPEDVDLIILGTDSPDYLTPATSVVLQEKLGAKNAGTFDVGCACASFPTGFAAAAGLIATNPGIRTVLVTGVYLMHKLASASDPMTFFYGDGAGAAVLEASAEPRFLNAAFQADGAYAGHWGIFAGGTAEPASEESVQAGRTTVKMIQRYPPEINHEGWPRLVRRLAQEGGFALDEIDFLIFTQVRKPSIELVMNELGLPLEKTHTVMEEWGYTGSACVPMALHDAREKGKIQSGDLVVLVGSGVGYNQAAVAFRA
jgi:3-oxoacyl-[acyl-carrier-protein] synthase III